MIDDGFGPAPYTPGFGTTPFPFVGRVRELATVFEALQAADAGYSGAAIRLIGLRGTGKTSFLAEIERILTSSVDLGVALQRVDPEPWVVLRCQADPGLDATLSFQAAKCFAELEHDSKWRVESFRLNTPVGGINAQRQPVLQNEPVTELLKRVASVVAATGRNLVLLVDEIHEATEQQLRWLVGLINEQAGRPRPMILITAELPDQLMLDHITFFRDRATQIPIGNLDEVQAAAALRAPAELKGVRWTDNAVDYVVEASQGYPYAIQVFARHAWNARTDTNVIDFDAAHAGVSQGEANELDQMYFGRWDGLTGRQKTYLSALAALTPHGQTTHPADVATSLGNPPTYWSGVLKELRLKGAVIHTRGKVQIALPGWAKWINTHHRVDNDPEGSRNGDEQ